ncbi:MAG TPA: hypothetical protein VN376_10085 [Longilinea sp.]|nr:hypothetical protein [Longilinea sp.]
MSAIEKIAASQNRRDEVPNQDLARILADREDTAGIREIAENLWNKDPAVKADCIKVLYEIGYLKPQLIAPYAGDFLKLLTNRNNRLVWGAMIALAAIAPLQADDLFPEVEKIKKVMAEGSVITVDCGVKVLAGIASQRPAYRQAIFPYLAEHLRTCRPKEVPQHAESILAAVDGTVKQVFLEVLQKRETDLSPAQITRIRKVVRAAEKKV